MTIFDKNRRQWQIPFQEKWTTRTWCNEDSWTGFWLARPKRAGRGVGMKGRWTKRINCSRPRLLERDEAGLRGNRRTGKGVWPRNHQTKFPESENNSSDQANLVRANNHKLRRATAPCAIKPGVSFFKVTESRGRFFGNGLEWKFILVGRKSRSGLMVPDRLCQCHGIGRPHYDGSSSAIVVPDAIYGDV